MTPLKSVHKRTAKRLLLATAVCLLGIHALFLLTKGNAKRSEQQHLVTALQRVLPRDTRWDNDLLTSQTTQNGQTAYWACQGKEPRYHIIEFSTQRGYNGLIRLLLSIDLQQSHVSQVRPLFHQETPGLGDQIAPNKSDWLKQFTLPLPIKQPLKLRRDGGNIDSIAGATITARAVTHAVTEVLNKYPSHNANTALCEEIVP